MIAPHKTSSREPNPSIDPFVAEPEQPAFADRSSVLPAQEDEDVFVFPATAAQRRFWLLDQLVPGGNSALNMPLGVRLSGRLDREALGRSFNEVVRRHEVLRTTFHCERGQLRQLITPSLVLPIPLVDVREFPAAERERLPEHLLAEEAQKPFDLARGPVIRAELVRVSLEEHLLLITVHHIVSDGWSNGVLLRELGELYTAFVRGQPSPLPELPIQFADFCQWQQEHAADHGLADQMPYWREVLAGELPVLDLPTDRLRRPVRGHAPQGGVRQEVLPAALVQALKALAVSEGVSAYMLYLAAYTVLLSRYSGGQEDVLVNTPSANRDRREVEPLIGPFVNPLLLRTDLSGDPTFGELLRRVRRVVLGAFEHAAVPFERLIEELPPRRLQANFLYQTNFIRPARLPNLDLVPLAVASGGILAEWSASVTEDGVDSKFSIVYNADLFEPATMDRVVAGYQRLLEAIAAPGGLETPVSKLPVEVASEAAHGAVLLAQRWRLPAESVRWMDGCFAAQTTRKEGEFGLAKAGIEILVLDRHLQPAPNGVVGEIYVRGMPDCGAEALVATCDLGRRRIGNRIEWLGRVNKQVMVRGLRVHPDEIAAALRAHPHIEEAVVLWEGQDSGGPRFTAYVQGDDTPQALIGDGQLRDFLREKLPEELLPAKFMVVERFPLTSDGRLDAAALSDQAVRSGQGTEEKYNAPYLTIHHQLIDLWQQLLGLPQVGIRDDFFALGGSSLLAMRMLYRIEQIFGKALLPVTLFTEPTIEHLADEMLKNEEGKPAAAVVIVNDRGSKTPIFYLHGDFHGGGFYSMKLSRHLGPDQPFYALPPAELTDPSTPPTIQEMAAAQIRSLREVRPHGPYVIGGFCLGGLIAYEVAQQLTAAGETVERLLIIDAILRNPRLVRLRRAAEFFGRRRGLSADRQLYLFCRWHFLLARLERWRSMAWSEKARVMGQHAGALWRRVGHALQRLKRSNRTAPESGPTTAPEADWFDPRWDVPLVYLWSAGGYLPKPYAGATTVLLSKDLYRAPRHRGKHNWGKYLNPLDVRELPGSHLACITEHVDALAETIVRCLETATDAPA